MQDQLQYFDAHNHLLDFPKETLDQIMKQAYDAGVTHSAPNCTSESSYEPMLQLYGQYKHKVNGQADYSQVIPSFGIHPCYIHLEKENPNWKEKLINFLQIDELFGVGEIGLDYRTNVLQQNQKQAQQTFFVDQLELSFLMNRPVTVHNVRAHGQMLKIFKKYNTMFAQSQKKAGAKLSCGQQNLASRYKMNPIVMHSYGGSTQVTKSLLKLTKLNIFFSLSLRRTQKLCQIIPIQRLVLQTDAPYQNDMAILSQEGIISQLQLKQFGQLKSQDQNKQLVQNNRLKNIKANTTSLCKYYNMDAKAFSHKIYQNSLKIFRLLK